MITTARVRLVKTDLSAIIAEYSVENSNVINKAAIEGDSIIIALSQGNVLYFSLGMQLDTLQPSNKFDFGAEVSSVALSET